MTTDAAPTLAPRMPLRTYRAGDDVYGPALERARREGITLSHVLRDALAAYAAGDEQGDAVTDPRRVHFMGDAGVQNTACNRYVPLTGTGPRWSADASAVTCRRCLAAIA